MRVVVRVKAEVRVRGHGQGVGGGHRGGDADADGRRAEAEDEPPARRARGQVEEHLQPYVVGPATVRGGACNRTWWDLRPSVLEAAALV